MNWRKNYNHCKQSKFKSYKSLPPVRLCFMMLDL